MAFGSGGFTSGGTAGAALEIEYGAPVQDVVTLRAIGEVSRNDQQQRLVEDKGVNYRFDSTGVGADDGDLIIVPTVGSGRWFKTSQVAGGAPVAHAPSHTDGTDDIQDATAAQKGVATSTQITKLDGIATGADVTGSNPPQAHAALHSDGGTDEVTVEDLATGETNTSLGLKPDGVGGLAFGAVGDGVSAFHADQLDNPNNANWAVNALAPAVADSNNAGLTVRLFDDTTEEGVGFILTVPTSKTNIKLSFKSRAETAPGAARTVGLKLYQRGIPNNAAVEAWSAGLALTDIGIPTNEFFQYDTQTITLATLGITPGELTQFELTRINPAGGTELVGDWALEEILVEFT